jgi:hypothetical protein
MPKMWTLSDKLFISALKDYTRRKWLAKIEFSSKASEILAAIIALYVAMSVGKSVGRSVSTSFKVSKNALKSNIKSHSYISNIVI